MTYRGLPPGFGHGGLGVGQLANIRDLVGVQIAPLRRIEAHPSLALGKVLPIRVRVRVRRRVRVRVRVSVSVFRVSGEVLGVVKHRLWHVVRGP